MHVRQKWMPVTLDECKKNDTTITVNAGVRAVFAYVYLVYICV